MMGLGIQQSGCVPTEAFGHFGKEIFLYLMTKLVVKSLMLGFIIGIIFFAVFPLGLVIAFVEFLRPLLIPGHDLFKSLWQTSGFVPASQWIFAIALNGVIYTILFFSILLIKKNVTDSRMKFFVIVVVILMFFSVTGMLTNLYYFFISPNKSWIFQIGA